MATKRFGYLDDFTLKNTKVGIGTSTPQEKVEVIGGTRSKDLRVIGIATLSSHGGFINDKTSYVENLTIESGESGTLSGEIVVGSGLTMTVSTGATTGQGSIKSLKVSNTFNPPIGGTVDRPTAPIPGALFYNKDFRTIEFWDGNFWKQVDNTTTRGRALSQGGQTPGAVIQKRIEYIEIATLGNAVSFGDLTSNILGAAACSSNIRGLNAGGLTPSYTDTIDYTTIASACNAIDFGNLGSSRLTYDGAFSSSTRGLWAGGYVPGSVTNVIEFVEISTTGNVVDFGDMTTGGRHNHTASSTPTRGCIFAGKPATTQVDTVTISNKGNTIDFGDVAASINTSTACSNATRAVLFGGEEMAGGRVHTMDYFNMTSGGNAQVFGDMTGGERKYNSSASSPIRGVTLGGRIPSNVALNYIEYITFASLGNSEDFGDLSHGRYEGSACSDSHGGLGGF